MYKKIRLNKDLSLQFIKYCLSGLLGAVVDYVIYISLIGFGININISKTISFIVAISLTFVLNKFFTFQNKKWALEELRKYLILLILVFLAHFIVNLIMYQITYDIELSFIFAIVAHILVNFTGQKLWVFKRKNINTVDLKKN